MERDVKLDISITTMDTHNTVAVKGLLDNGATGMFINREFIHRNGLKTRILPHEIKVYNMDGTLNKGGSITEGVTMMMSHIWRKWYSRWWPWKGHDHYRSPMAAKTQSRNKLENG